MATLLLLLPQSRAGTLLWEGTEPSNSGEVAYAGKPRLDGLCGADSVGLGLTAELS